MKNKMFSGWKDILLFTCKQGFNQKYRIVTLILVGVLFAGGFGGNLILAKRQQNRENVSPIEKVYLIDQSGVDNIGWNDSKQLDAEQFPKVVFEETSLQVDELGLQLKNQETTSVIASVTKEKHAFKIQIYLPYGSEVTNEDGENLAKAVKNILYEGMIHQAGIDSDKVVYVVSGINTEYSTVGEKLQDEGSMMFISMFPLIFMFGLYFMVIIYGQSMGQVVCIEKTSKLMETLLVMTRPYGLIFGKILATAGIAILQMALCVGALCGGFLFGDSFARSSIYEGYDNPVLSMLQDVAADEAMQAFTNKAILLTVIAVCLAFIFYCMLAGAIASFASKADELGSVMMFYNFFLVIGFLGSYALPNISGQEWVKVLVRLVPVSSAFILPGEILLGTVKAGPAAGYLLVLLIWTIVTAIFAGKIYRDQVFYNGKGLLDRLPWMKKKKAEDDNEPWELLHDEAGRPLEKSQKIGYFFLAISPLAIFFVLQILASLVLTNVITRWDFRGIDITTWEVKELVDYYHKLEFTLNPLSMIVIHSLIILTFGLWMYFLQQGKNRKNCDCQGQKSARILSGLSDMLGVKSLLQKKLAVVGGVCLVCGLGLLVLANGVVAIEAETVPTVVENYSKMAQTTGLGTNPFAIIAAVCMAPIGEEFLCRGVCFHFGKKSLGKFWYANILQALLFGILHMNWVQGVYAFIIGLVLGLLVERYESLLPAMLVHFIVNFSSSTWFPKVLTGVEATLTMGIMMVAIPGLIVIATLYLTRE